MNTYFKAAVLATAAIATVFTSVEFASAGGRHYYWRHPHHHGHYNDALAAGIIGGVAAGVIAGAIAAGPGPEYIDEGPIYDDPDVVYAEPDDEYGRPVDGYDGPADEEYVRPRDRGDVYDDRAMSEDDYPPPPQRRERYEQSGSLEPWTGEWRAYCSQRYQTFNARTGTYRGYDGQDHFCTAG